MKLLYLSTSVDEIIANDYAEPTKKEPYSLKIYFNSKTGVYIDPFANFKLFQILLKKGTCYNVVEYNFDEKNKKAEIFADEI